MARPSVLHPGFLVPNAGGVTSPQMAEPDQVDFNILGNARYGVLGDALAGCLVTVSGLTATNTPGTALVNGKLVMMAGGQTCNIGVYGSQDRYDLLCVDSSGTLTLIAGAGSNDPVFPDPPTTVTVLAAVFCNLSNSYSDNVIDKRKFLPEALLTKIGTDKDLVVNRDDIGSLFRIDGSGITSWKNDTLLQRVSEKTLQVTENLKVVGDLGAGGALTAQSLVTKGRVTSSNLKSGSTPTVTQDDPPSPGDIFQSSSGSIYVYKSVAQGWTELAVVSSIIPVGTVIQSLQPPSVMSPLGWVPLNGSSVAEGSPAFAALVTNPATAIAALAGLVTGAPGHRMLKMPDASDRVLMTDFNQTAATLGGSKDINILLTNMPRHRHNTTVSPGGEHTPTVSMGPAGRHQHGMQAGGKHPHVVQQTPHKHNGMEGPNNTRDDVIALCWGGQNKIDAYFNDRSHTFSVEAYQWTAPALANVQVLPDDSEHSHIIEYNENHTHPLTFYSVPAHPHAVTELDVGDGTPITYRPEYLTVFTYVRAFTPEGTP